MLVPSVERHATSMLVLLAIVNFIVFRPVTRCSFYACHGIRLNQCLFVPAQRIRGLFRQRDTLLTSRIKCIVRDNSKFRRPAEIHVGVSQPRHGEGGAAIASKASWITPPFPSSADVAQARVYFACATVIRLRCAASPSGSFGTEFCHRNEHFFQYGVIFDLNPSWQSSI